MKQRYRVVPHPHQQVALAKVFGCARVVRDDALARSHGFHKKEQKARASGLMQLCITQAGQTPEPSWRAGSVNVVLQQPARDRDQALRNWWASLKGSPKGAKVSPRRLKGRHGPQSIRFTSHVFRPGERPLTLSKIGPVPTKWSRPLPSEPGSGAVIKDASGRHVVSFLVAVEPTSFPGNGQTIGTDLGLASLATPSDGVKSAPPTFLRSALKRLRRLQRNPKHKQDGSGRPQATRQKVAKLHTNVDDRCPDHLRQLSNCIICGSRTVVLEDLNVSGMVRNRTLACSIPDGGWRQLRALLEFKAQQYGRKVIVVSRWLPTSRMCLPCGHQEGKKDLSVRQWQCPDCGAVLDRDVKPARTILAPGPAERLNGREAMGKTAPAVPTRLITGAPPCPA